MKVFLKYLVIYYYIGGKSIYYIMRKLENIPMMMTKIRLFQTRPNQPQTPFPKIRVPPFHRSHEFPLIFKTNNKQMEFFIIAFDSLLSRIAVDYALSKDELVDRYMNDNVLNNYHPPSHLHFHLELVVE